MCNFVAFIEGVKRMKKYFIILPVIVLGWASCQPSGNTNRQAAVSSGHSEGAADHALTQNPDVFPVLSVADTSHDFGTVRQGDIVEYSFKFKNTGKKDLIITYASSTCGCTVPDYPKKPVKPGEEGFITVSFNSADKTGHQEKPIFILANTQPPQTNLKITAEVVKK